MSGPERPDTGTIRERARANQRRVMGGAVVYGSGNVTSDADAIALCDALEAAEGKYATLVEIAQEQAETIRKLREHYHVEDNWCMQCGAMKEGEQA